MYWERVRVAKFARSLILILRALYSMLQLFRKCSINMLKLLAVKSCHDISIAVRYHVKKTICKYAAAPLYCHQNLLQEDPVILPYIMLSSARLLKLPNWWMWVEKSTTLMYKSLFKRERDHGVWETCVVGINWCWIHVIINKVQKLLRNHFWQGIDQVP